MLQINWPEADPLKCVEHGTWVDIPRDPPAGRLLLRLKDVEAAESAAIKRRKIMTFHMAGCTGHFHRPIPQDHVASAMIRQIVRPHCYGGTKHALAPSFFYHLGDIVYKDEDKTDEQRPDQQKLYQEHFYVPYADYERSIFAVAGNHDGKDARNPDKHPEKSPIRHFLSNFCAAKRKPPSDDPLSKRYTMIQPYPYWLFKTPLAYFVGLYTNDVNAGQLDNPENDQRPQFDWLVKTLRKLRKTQDGRAIFVVVHYPPLSGATNFKERGDPNVGRCDCARKSRPLAMILEEAYEESGLYPDAVFSAHAHHYQRITYTQAGGREIPHLIVGCGGHAPIEPLAHCCSGEPGVAPATPCDVVLPDGLTLPPGARARLVAYNNQDFGFLRLTLDMRKKHLIGEFFAAYSETRDSATLPALEDAFCLDLREHRVK